MSGRNRTYDRRSFLGAAGTAAFAAVSMSSVNSSEAQSRRSRGKEKIALVGTGIRGSGLWGTTLNSNYSDVIEFVGLCDINPKRLAFVKQHMRVKCPTFTDFDEMIKKTRPDRVIVTTTDCFHAKYICRTMELGRDVITEKPMATDEKMCQDILDTEKRTGRKVTVTFNYRYSPDAERIKEILNSGVIGRVTSVDFHYYLDTSHGASYFRRWHAFKQFSGSLLVHKATHHFDLMNWWLNAEPVEVTAFGRLNKYGFNSPVRSERCMKCQHKNTCEFYWDITKNEFLMNLYVKPETEDGYLRDACLFRKNINIWDTMAVQVRYHNDVMMSYSLNAFMPYEGFSVSFNGLKGRFDARIYHNQPWKVDSLADFRITPLFEESRAFSIQKGGGGHWGADQNMQDMIFRSPVPDPLGQAAGSRDGALSIMIGIAARRSIEQRRPFKIEEIVKI